MYPISHIPAMKTHGFTLIELSIVLVIIGLIVGGVLVGQDLIRAAEVRATLSQIEKYNTAVNTFRGKYNALPGDMPAATATAFGFTARGANAGEGDGNGVIEGVASDAASNNDGFYEATGETVEFWVDLSSANGLNVNLVDGGYSTGSPNTVPGATITGGTLNSYFPQAKLGRGNYIYVYSTGGTNYFAVSALSSIATGGAVTSGTSLSVQQAYSMDKKVDDGLPTTGSVTATYDTGSLALNAAAATANGANPVVATTCYDSTALTYAIGYNGGTGANCALSFRFQ